MTSANGYTTIINYNYSADKGGSWILTDKTVKTDNYDDPWIYDGKHRECITYTYDRERRNSYRIVMMLMTGYVKIRTSCNGLISMVEI